MAIVPQSFLGEVLLDGVVAGGAPGASTLRVWWARIGRPAGRARARAAPLGRRRRAGRPRLDPRGPPPPPRRPHPPHPPLTAPFCKGRGFTYRKPGLWTTDVAAERRRMPHALRSARSAWSLRRFACRRRGCGHQKAAAVGPLPPAAPRRVRRSGPAGGPPTALPAPRRCSCRTTPSLGGRSAASWFGAPFAPRLDPVRRPRAAEIGSGAGPRGVRVHRTDFSASDVQSTVDDLRMHGIGKDGLGRRGAGADRRPRSAMLDAHGAGRAHWTSTRSSRHARAPRPGRWRSQGCDGPSPLVDGRSESPPESWVRVACARAGLPSPVPQFEVVEEGEFARPGRPGLARARG